MTGTLLLDALAHIVSPANVITDSAGLAAYEHGARHDVGKAAFVVRPGTTAEVSQIVALCTKAGVVLIPQSGNTGLVGGSTPDKTGTQGILSLDRLTSPPVIDVVNRTVMVSAGTRLSTLNEALAPHGLFFPIDLGADPMIGGMVATNTGGARFIRYGDVRKNILGLEVVLSDGAGTVLDLTSDLRKNNTGVDLKQFFIGTCGAFGTVTRAVLEVHKIPKQTAAALLVPRDDDAILELLGIFEAETGVYLSAFEGMSHEAMKAAFGHVPSLRNPFARGEVPDYAILVELTRTWEPRAGEQSLETILESVLESAWELPSAPLSDAVIGRPDILWQLRHALSEGVKASGHIIAFDLSFSRSALPAFRRDMRIWLSENFPELRICDFGHVGDGGMHYNLVAPIGDGTKHSADYIRDLREKITGQVVETFGGSYSAEHAIGRNNQFLYDRYTPEANKRISGQIAEALGIKPFGSVHFGATAPR